jgi:hypothetical protein
MVPRGQLTIKSITEMKLKAVMQKHKLIKVVIDFSQKNIKNLALIQEAKTEGGM